MEKSIVKLKKRLDRFYREYDFPGRILHDPIRFPRRYNTPQDIEVAGFIASCLAYGKAELFLPVVQRILQPMGAHPGDFMLNFSMKRHAKLFQGIKYRFNENEDLLSLFLILHETLRRYHRLEAVFMGYYSRDDRNVRQGLTGFMGQLLSIDTSGIYGNNVKPAGLLQLFPSPVSGSPCKRANLFLRWMIRDRDIDLGIWRGVPKNKLVIPLDVHIARIGRCLALTKRRTQHWNTAEDITESLAGFDPEDPLKYDFALCHHGISGMCRGESHRTICSGCILRHEG